MKDAAHRAAIAEDIRRGLTSEEIRDEIIAKVGMMADARTPEMQARYDAALVREGKEDTPGGPVTRKSNTPIRSDVPTDRLTRLAEAAIDAFDEHYEHDAGDRCMVFISSEKDRRNGLVLHGYDNDADAILDLLVHLRAIFRANGKDLQVVPVGKTPEEDRG